jgi:hypothetical protein
MKNKNAGRVALATVAAALLGALVVPSAQALGTTTWSTVCAAYQGKSWYNGTYDTGYSQTTANDNDEVGAAVRYYLGSTAYTHGYGYALRTRSSTPYGGYHQSYCFPGTQTRSS